MDLSPKLLASCRPVAALLLALAAAFAGCAAETKRSKLPPPVYEQPTLPPWQAPAAEQPEGELGTSGGDWVDGPPPGAATPETPSDSVPPETPNGTTAPETPNGTTPPGKPAGDSPSEATGAPPREN